MRGRGSTTQRDTGGGAIVAASCRLHVVDVYLEVGAKRVFAGGSNRGDELVIAAA